ncbi:MAG: histidine kinase [Bacteroidetes bacterium]|nr:histidine kinase [Bacteroidota bacterium]
MKFFLAVFLSIILQSQLSSQHTYFQSVNQELSFPHAGYYHAFCDSKSRVWLSTDQGVFLMNGMQLISTFRASDGLQSNTIVETTEDSKGRIWFVSISAELSYFDNGKITAFAGNKAIHDFFEEIPIPRKKSFHVASNGSVYLGLLAQGTFRISPNGKIEQLRKPGKSEIDIIDNTAFPAGSSSFSCTEIEPYENGKHKKLSASDYKKTGLGYELFMSQTDGNYIFSQYNSILIFRGDTLWKSIRLPANIIWISGNNPDIWVGTSHEGLFKVSYNSTSVSCKQIIPDCSVSSVCTTPDGGLLVTTLENGLLYIPSDQLRTLEPSKGEAFECLSDIKGSLLAGSKKGKIAMIGPDLFQQYEWQIPARPIITDILYNTQFRQYCITTGTYFYLTENLEAAPEVGFEHTNTPGTVFQCIAEASDGNYWVGTVRTLVMLNPFSKTIHYNSKEEDIFLRVNCILQLPDSTVLAGCKNGLWIWHKGKLTELSSHLPFLEADFSCLVLHKGIIIAGSKDKGLYVWNGIAFQHFDAENGLPAQSISSITISPYGYWAATDQNLILFEYNRLNSTLKISKTLSEINGLPTPVINDLLFLNDTLWIATDEGIAFYSHQMSDSSYNNCPPVITNFIVNGEPVQSFEKNSLSWDMNSVSFEFATPDFSIPNPQFRFKLAGIDDDWTETRQTQVEFPFLPPGDYVFHLAIKNNCDEWVESENSVSFSISPAWWDTLIARIALLAIIISIVFLLSLLFFRQKRKRQELKHDLSKYMQQSLVRQLNPHFVFNSLNSIQNFIYNNDIDSSAAYLTRFSRLMRMNLDHSQREYISLSEELIAIEHFLEIEKLRFKDRLQFEIITAIDSVAEDIQIPPLLLQPIVENSIWHGLLHKEEGGKITIEVAKKDSLVEVTITDNGVGREQTQANRVSGHKSTGLSHTIRRLKAHNQLYGTRNALTIEDLKSNDGKQLGTKVTVSLSQQD